MLSSVVCLEVVWFHNSLAFNTDDSLETSVDEIATSCKATLLHIIQLENVESECVFVTVIDEGTSESLSSSTPGGPTQVEAEES